MPSKAGSAGLPAGAASPTGRMPHERSRVPTQRSGVTARSEPSTAMVPSQVPTWANRWASRIVFEPWRITCGSSWTTSNEPSQVRSSAMPSVSSITSRSLRSGSRTSIR